MSTHDEQKKLQARLLAKLTAKTFENTWLDVDLKQSLKHPATIKVCSPVYIQIPYDEVKDLKLPGIAKDPKLGFFLAIHAIDTLRRAKEFKAYPLTRSVADRLHNQALRFERPKKSGRYMDASKSEDVFDLVSCTRDLKTKYLPQHGKKLVSGAHKLWVLSNRGFSVNHGFHHDKKPPKKDASRPSLNPQFTSIQNIGHGHPLGIDWDYSQLLQFMKEFKVAGKTFNIAEALLTAHPAVWDEMSWAGATSPGPFRPKKEHLTLLGFPNWDFNPNSTVKLLEGWWKITYFGRTEYYRFSAKAGQIAKAQWTYTKPKTKGDAIKDPKDGYWIERNKKLIFSWRDTGTVERWDLGQKVKNGFKITVNDYSGEATKMFESI